MAKIKHIYKGKITPWVLQTNLDVRPYSVSSSIMLQEPTMNLLIFQSSVQFCVMILLC